MSWAGTKAPTSTTSAGYDKTCFVALADMVHDESAGTFSLSAEQRNRHAQLAGPGQLKPASKAKAKASKKRKLAAQSKKESYGPSDFGPGYSQAQLQKLEQNSNNFNWLASIETNSSTVPSLGAPRATF